MCDKSIMVYVMVEGQTERNFVKELLVEYFSRLNIYLIPVLHGKPGMKGGNVRYEVMKRDVRNFLRQQPDIYIATMYDYFRIDPAWPGLQEITKAISDGSVLSPYEKAEKIEKATFIEISDAFPENNSSERFIPYFSMHEFEALLFSDSRKLAKAIDVDVKILDQYVLKYDTPEHINDDPEYAPSKLLNKLTGQRFRKTTYGIKIAKFIGLDCMRMRCSIFNKWIKKLESLPGLQ